MNMRKAIKLELFGIKYGVHQVILQDRCPKTIKFMILILRAIIYLVVLLDVC